MKAFKSIIFLLFISPLIAYANTSNFKESDVTLKTTTGDILGSLCVPEGNTKFPLAIIIAGSGPTDRNGNNPAMTNNSLMLLAHGLSNNNIASLRFDKRGIAKSAAAGLDENALRFETYVDDLKAWISMMKKDARFSKIILIGHSEGSLIGMLASDSCDKYISIAGPGNPADIILKEQLKPQGQAIQDMCYPLIDSLKAGKTLTNVNPLLYSLFRPSVQQYMISWFRYNPSLEIAKIKIPILIIQGNNDIQVPVTEAVLLHASNPKSRLLLVDSMNHIFKIVENDYNKNLASYSNPELAISDKMLQNIIAFIREE